LRTARFVLFGLTVLALAGARGAAAQITTGAISGTVVDQTGASIAGAQVTAKNTATSATQNTTSGEEGLFRFPVLAVGPYEITVEKQGFNTTVQKNVVVTVGASIHLTLRLAVAAQTTTVTVTEETPLIESTRTQVSNTVTDKSVANLPINGRNFIDFVLLTPGVTRDVRGGDISFAGQRGTLNSLTVDGADNNNTFFGQTLGRSGAGRNPYQFSQDAVQEFQVSSNSFNAEFGRAGGAVINVVTKSGTNQFHGTAFWFYRDRSLNATDLVTKNAGRPKAPYHFNQFGGNLGGPIIPEKAFFFVDYDGQRNKLANTTFLQLPTGFVAATPFETQALAYLTARANSYLRSTDNDVLLVKGDWHLNASNHLSARWNRGRFTGANNENSGSQNSEEHSGASLVHTDTLTFNLTSTLSPTQINVARVSWQKDREPGQANSSNPEATVRQAGATVLTVGRNFFSPRETTITRWQVSDTFTWTSGRHTLRFGFDVMADDIFNFFPGNFSGAYTFQNLDDFGRSLAGAAVSASASFVQAFGGTGTSGPSTFPDIREYSGFFQDEWRVNSDFTVNFGLRYDVQNVAKPPVFNPSLALANAGIRTDFINTDWNNWGPRAGLAWTPWGNKKLVVRGGYGMFYGRTPSIMVGTAHSNNGINVVTLTFNTTTNPVLPSYPNSICGAPSATPSCAAPSTVAAAAASIYVFDRNYAQPWVQQVNGGFEYEFLPNWSFGATYLGVRAARLQRTRDINTPTTVAAVNIPIAGASTPTTLTFQQFSGARPIAGFVRISQFESTAESHYNGLTLQVNKRFSRNYQLAAAYTLGKVTDTNPDATAVVPFGSDDAKMVYNPAVPELDRAPGNNDQRSRMVISAIWALNYLSDRPAAVRAILGGWELSGIFTAETGLPYTPLVNFDLNGDGNSRNERVPGTLRNSLRHPGIISFDPRVTKNFPLHESFKFQFIMESFNIFNRANIGATVASPVGVNTTQFSRSTTACGSVGSPCLVPNAAFATPTAVRDPRIIQFALKAVF